MNWYKTAQNVAPITIVSYIPSYGELGISFNGSKKYIYEKINPRDYNYLENLLKNKNYKKAQEILRRWSLKNKETEGDKQEMVDELYERGYLGNIP